MKIKLLAVLCFASAFALAVPAFADGGGAAGGGGGQVEVFLSVRPADQKDPKQAGHAPEVEATIVGGQKTTRDKFSISTTYQNQKISLEATRIRDYVDGTEPIAIALVINGQEIWIGNDDIETDDNAKYQGVLKNLETAIDKLGLGTLGPPGSKGVVISYSQGTETKFPMADLKQITGGVLGSQKDYRGKIVPRNSSRTPWYNGLDARLSQDIPVPALNSHSLQLTLDVINLLNLINSDWGKSWYVSSQNDVPWTLQGTNFGVDPTTGQQRIVWTPRPVRFAMSQLGSRWQIQLGIRYKFD